MLCGFRVTTKQLKSRGQICPFFICKNKVNNHSAIIGFVKMPINNNSFRLILLKKIQVITLKKMLIDNKIKPPVL